MGLLDEAIRDHLELKRRRGADPGEIAREEREALEPVFPDEPRPAAFADEPQAELLDPAPPHGDPLAEETAQEWPAPAGADEPAPAHDLSGLAQETAELDMQAVLEQDERLANEAAAAPPANEAPSPHEALSPHEAPLAHQAPSPHEPPDPPATPIHAEATIEDELLEWTDPEHALEPPPEPLPGQERLSFE